MEDKGQCQTATVTQALRKPEESKSTSPCHSFDGNLQVKCCGQCEPVQSQCKARCCRSHFIQIKYKRIREMLQLAGVNSAEQRDSIHWKGTGHSNIECLFQPRYRTGNGCDFSAKMRGRQT